MQAPEPAMGDLALNPPSAQAGRRDLRRRDHAVLPAGEGQEQPLRLLRVHYVDLDPSPRRLVDETHRGGAKRRSRPPTAARDRRNPPSIRTPSLTSRRSLAPSADSAQIRHTPATKHAQAPRSLPLDARFSA